MISEKAVEAAAEAIRRAGMTPAPDGCLDENMCPNHPCRCAQRMARAALEAALSLHDGGRLRATAERVLESAAAIDNDAAHVKLPRSAIGNLRAALHDAPVECNSGADCMSDAADIKRAENSHIWEREQHEHYVEPEWCSRALPAGEHQK